MLGTRERTLLLESLRPPAGYRLERAIGTSYTLDLIALLTAPLAFTFFDVHDEEGEPVGDPVALLEALRRHAERVTLFCQAGAIAVPKPAQALLAYLEGSVIEVRAPLDEGVFHPKVWVLGFVSEDGPPVYRLLCLSRNLTFDRAWDTCLCLEGSRTDRSFARNAPLRDLLAALPRLATRRLSSELAAELHRMAEDVMHVDLRPPTPFDDFRIHPLGLTPGHGWPFPARGRSLAISPYLVGSIVNRLVRDHGLEVLVSRPEAFEELQNVSLPERCYVLSSAAQLDSREPDEDVKVTEPPTAATDLELSGLHAKLFLFEDGPTARLFTGSANATRAAFELNVELLVELVGSSKVCGIAALLGDEDDAGVSSLRTLLELYVPEGTGPVDPEQQALERRVDRLARLLGAARLTARVGESEEEDRYDVRLSGAPPDLPSGVEVRVWPVTLTTDAARPVEDAEAGVIATFHGLSFEALTAFFAFEISAREGSLRASRRFSVTVELIGAPEDRKERLLRSFLKNRRQVLRLLLLLLMDEGADVSLFVDAARRDEHASRWPFGGREEPTLLEALLRSLSRDPARVDHAARLIADLGRTPEGRDLLPEGLEEIWESVWAVREEVRR